MATYVPSATDVAAPADVGILASSAAAEFRTVKLYMRDVLLAGVNARAPIASPTFTGVPAAPTAAVDTNTTQLATTAYVIGQGYLKSAAAAATYAPLASPALTGNPTAPTQAPGTNNTRLASTAFVTAAVAAGNGGGSAYAPTYVNAGNITGVSTGEVNWSRSGNIVTMTGRLYYTTIAANTQCTVDMPIPVGGAFVNSIDAVGIITELLANGKSTIISLGGSTNIRLSWNGPGFIGGDSVGFMLQYLVR